MRIDLAALTAGQPFRAGVLLVHRGRLVLTLDDDLPADLAGRAVRLKWVGGGQEPHENLWECALREAHEEAGVAVDLVPSPVTYLHDPEEAAEPRPVECEDGDPPLLVERITRPNADVGDRPDLPAGPYLYAVTFLALAGDAAELRPGSDLHGLLLVRPELWPRIEAGTTVEKAVAAGAELVGGDGVPRRARLWVHPQATIRVAVPLLGERAVADAVGLAP